MSASASHALPPPLAGLRVLDLTVALSGPFCTLLLAGLGAEVIKIEAPKSGDLARFNPPFYGPKGFHFGPMGEGDLSVSNLLRARNKKSITLDLKTDEGRALFMRLAKTADIVAENMSEGTAERLGVGYRAVKAANPRIIYASISGLGDPSAVPGVKAMDIIVQALSGVMDVTGSSDGPPMRFGLPIADLTAPLYALSGILAAVIQRQQTGQGQHVKVSMLDAMASLLAVEHFDVFGRSGFPVRTGNHHNRLCPFGIYATRDGYIAIAATADGWARGLLEAMGDKALLSDARFKDRSARVVNADAMNALIEKWTRVRATEEAVQVLTEHSVPCAPVRSVSEVLADPWLRNKGAVNPLVHPRLGPIDAVGPGVPIEFSGATVSLDQPARELGADNRDIYGALLGLSEAELAELKSRKII